MQGRGFMWVSVLAALACLLAVEQARSARIVVDSDAELRAAIQRLAGPGGTIVVRKGRYRSVVVGPRSSRRLTILAGGATTRSLLFLGTKNVRVVGLRVSSPYPPLSEVRIERSWRVVLDRVSVYGTDGSRARVRLERSLWVRIEQSRFRRCGEEDACILLGKSRNVRLVANEFGACHNCDCVRGRLGARLVIRGNEFGRIVRAHCAPGAECNHQDHLQLQRGTDIVIERNRFGIYENGAAQIYLSGPLRRVRIVNNAFRGTDPSRPGFVAHVGITVGNRVERVHPPFGVLIAHNTILSGALHLPRGSESSIALTPLFRNYPRSLRPVVVNNVLAVLKTPAWVCGPAGSSIRNIIREGQVCSATDLRADPQVGPVWGVPTASSPVIDYGQPGWATVDLKGVRRDARPDVGAYEYVGR